MSTKHTPGPWYRASNTIQGLVISEVTGANIAVTYDPNDADLIAAAPELLMFAEFVVSTLADYGEFADVVQEAHAVINNAKGIK